MAKKRKSDEEEKPTGRKSLKITRTPLHQLYGLMKRSNFYSNSLLSIISKHQVKSALKNLPPAKPGQMNIKCDDSKLAKFCGTKMLDSYNSFISSYKELNVGSELILKVAATVECLVNAVSKEKIFGMCYVGSIEKSSKDFNTTDLAEQPASIHQELPLKAAETNDDCSVEVNSSSDVHTRLDKTDINFSDCSNFSQRKECISPKFQNIVHWKNIEETPNGNENNCYDPDRSSIKCCRNIFQKDTDLNCRNSVSSEEKPRDEKSYEFSPNTMPDSINSSMQEESFFVLESILSQLGNVEAMGTHQSMNIDKPDDCGTVTAVKEMSVEFDKENLDDESQHMDVDDCHHGCECENNQLGCIQSQSGNKLLNSCDNYASDLGDDCGCSGDTSPDTAVDDSASCKLESRLEFNDHQATHEKVMCPVCSIALSTQKINEHLDICLGSSGRKRSLRHTRHSAESETSADKISSSVAVVKNKYTELPPEKSLEKQCNRFRDKAEARTESTGHLCLSEQAIEEVGLGDEAAAVSCLLSESKKLKSDQKKEIMDMQVQESERKQIALCENDMSHMRQLNLSDNDMIERAYEKLDEIEIDTYDSAICSEEEDDSLSSQEVYDLMTSNPAGPVRRSSRTKNHKSYQEESDTEESEAEEKDESSSSQEKKVKTETFSEGEIVEILYPAGDTKKKYKARILNSCRTNSDGYGYLVHYIGWSDYFDDWVLEDDIAIESFKENSNLQFKSIQKDHLLSFKSISDKEKLILAEKFYMPPHSNRSPIKELKTEKQRHKGKENGVQPALLNGGVLRDYQITGFEWLKTMLENGENGILADEMGLGKTIQCIAAVCHMIKIGMYGPFLVCAPMSTIQNWFLEFRRFAPQLPLLLYHGTSEERATLSLCMLQVEHKSKARPVVITSFDVLMRDRVILQAHTWSYLIVDEGHRIKNLKCKLLHELNHIQAKSKLLLTGTPLQNNLTELWSLLNFLLPEVFDDLKTFESWFDLNLLKKDERLLTVIHQILTPFILRRMKDDVNLKLPPKREIIVHTPLSDKQERVYQALVNKSIDEILKQKELSKSTMAVADPVEISQQNEKSDQVPKSDNENRKRMTRSCAGPKREANESKTTTVSTSNVIMQLRKCCNHPYLLDNRLNDYAFQADSDLISSSGKMIILDQLLRPLKHRGHKVLLFSQMTRLLDIVEEYCLLREFNYVRFDGQTSREERVKKVNQFNKNANVFIFLLSTRAGGLGINLTAADTVIIYDSDWNPQNDAQAQDRCHRIGQVRPVVIYRFVTPGTVDERIIERAAEKAELEKIIMHKARFKGNLEKELTDRTKILSGELLDLLKVFDLKRKCNDKKASTLLSDEDLERLLDRSNMK